MMNEPTLGNVIRRLERLERQNRLLKSVGIAMLVVMTAAACEVADKLKKETFAEVRAGKFIVTGGNNEQLAVLGEQGLTLRGPGANIILRNVDEKDSPKSFLIDNPLQFQPYISLQGRNGNIRLDVGEIPDKEATGFGPFLSIDNMNKLKNESQKDSIELSLTDGKPNVNLYKDRKFIWGAP
jgi:hypothetical protein